MMFNLEMWSEVVIEIIKVMVLTAIPILGRLSFIWLKNKGILEGLKAKEELAMIAVSFAEETYRHLDGPGKYKEALAWLSGRMKEQGIKVSEKELEGLINDALGKLKYKWDNIYEDV